jgi:hypothetical protein
MEKENNTRVLTKYEMHQPNPEFMWIKNYNWFSILSEVYKRNFSYARLTFIISIISFLFAFTVLLIRIYK